MMSNRRRRFRVRELSEIKQYEGKITLVDLRKRFNIPDRAEVTVRVPGGADWSNTDLSLMDVDITVRWEEVK